MRMSTRSVAQVDSRRDHDGVRRLDPRHHSIADGGRPVNDRRCRR